MSGRVGGPEGDPVGTAAERTRRFAVRHVVTDEGVLRDCAVTVIDGRITDLRSGVSPVADEPMHPGWLLPGYVDTHVHGAVGSDFGSADADGVTAIIDHHRAHGSTTLYASLVTNTLDSLTAQLDLLAGFVERGDLAGVHLEGPFLSEARCGAHPAPLLRDPDPAAVDRLLDAGRGTVKMVTLAPERPGTIEAIGRFLDAGVIVAFGHSDADAALAQRSVESGATVATHLFNAMAAIHHRRPGPVPGLLSDPRVAVELICDGFHLHPDVVSMAISAAGPERVMLVTDAMAATGRPDGEFPLGELMTRVVDGKARLLESDGSLGNIAGSTLTMDRAVEFVVQECGVPMADAALMASTTPARWHRLAAGRVRHGAPADLVLVDDSGSLQAVMAAGTWLSEPPREG